MFLAFFLPLTMSSTFEMVCKEMTRQGSEQSTLRLILRYSLQFSFYVVILK
jgi:hypothetical protein